ncbi:hypothetical protein BK010_00710 [Tenericutes bacterium MO-XQ]|nr:hypothetical protein BK010_00710 [Tenericutes bacterium MO-XQ]
MQVFFEIVLLITAFLSVIPAIKIFKNRRDKKYTCLKVLIFSTFFWTLLILLERISSSQFLIYYAGMMRYPLKLLFASLMLCTIFQYVEYQFPKLLKGVLFIFVIVDFTIALTNTQTLLFLNLEVNQLSSFNDLYQAQNGSLFIYHLILSYVIAVLAIVLLFIFLTKQKGVRQYKEITRTLALSTAAVLVINLLQHMIYIVNIDLTYVSLVLFAYMLYDVIYKKDMIFNLRTSGRSEILANMREMYVLTDHEKSIVEVSPLLLDKYNLSFEEVVGKPFNFVVEKLKDKVTLYSEYDMTEDDYQYKDHYHLREKDFKLKGMNESGHMILLYDETQVYHLLRELNHLSNYDAMTGLNNRNYIEHKISEIKILDGLSIFSIDINGLKINNDYLGHERGDYLLKSLAKHLKTVFKNLKDKEIARIGGDEFIVMVKGLKESELKQKQKELLEICNNKDIMERISISVGYASTSEDDASIYQIIQKADILMYQMKDKVSKLYQQEMIAYIKLQDKFMR